MKIKALLITAIFFCLSATAQETKNEIVSVKLPEIQVDSTSYPAGVYAELKDFLAKKPSRAERNAPLLWKKGFFYYKLDPGSKIQAFAISHGGILYFQTSSIVEYKLKDGRSEKSVSPNRFVPVLIEGKNYMYTECNFGNGWALAVGASTVPAAAMAAANFTDMGIVWDRTRLSFRIMKFCPDWNEFIAPLKPEFQQPCDKKRDAPQHEGMREALRAIKSL